MMREWIINGNRELRGEIKVEGAKNALLAILPSSIIVKGIVHLENVTPLKDTYKMINILKKLNVNVFYDNKSKMIIDSRNVKYKELEEEEIKEIRASYYCMGALLSLFKKAKIRGPGGCKLGSRPIDLHLFAFDKLGYKAIINNDIYEFKKTKLKTKTIIFKKASMGATINAILVSVRLKDTIKLVNASLEPEVDDLIRFLNKCGAKIIRKDNEIIIGYGKLKGCKYKIMYDRIEAGTYLILGACIGNNLKIIYNESEYLKSLIELLVKIGVDLKINKEHIIVNKIKKIDKLNLEFDYYPALPTDLQQPLSILMSKSEECVIKDKIFPARYTQIEELNKMGFKMEIRDKNLMIRYSDTIIGKEVSCKDLRGGVSLLIAGLIAKGETRITRIDYIERGYYNLINKIQKIGGIINEKN